MSLACAIPREFQGHLIVGVRRRTAYHTFSFYHSRKLPTLLCLKDVHQLYSHKRVASPNFRSASISQRLPNLPTIRSRSLKIVRRLLLESLASADVPVEFVAKYYLRVVPTSFVEPSIYIQISMMLQF